MKSPAILLIATGTFIWLPCLLADEFNTTLTEHTAQPDAPGLFHSGPVPRTAFLTADAKLNDVCGIGQHCWAAGERGVIVRSTDNGVTWHTSAAPVDCSLRSIGFLTNALGYAGGFRLNPSTRQFDGVLLRTRDGGESWTQVPASLQPAPSNQNRLKLESELPPVLMVRFFDLENGIAICQTEASESNSEVVRTNDGGQTWQPLVQDTKGIRWRTGDFLTINDGVIVGAGNSAAAVLESQVTTLAPPQRDLRNLRDASLDRNGHGWLAGDAGTLLNSTDRGVSWNPPPGRLSQVLNNLLDYRTVDHTGQTVCIAGSPGSVVLHSADNGNSWTFRKLSNGAPIEKLRFVDDQTVLAVGAFGIIHRSSDAGLTWTAVRNAQHRAAVLSLTTDAKDASFRLLSDISGEQGYRSVVWQPSGELPRGGTITPHIADQMDHMVSLAGGNAFEADWMFARTQPLQHLVPSELQKAWSRQTDGRVSELLPQRLARAIRIWRPDVLTIEGASSGDAVAEIWQQTMTAAIKIADGADSKGQILDRTGLAPWTVSHVFVRQHGTNTSALSFRGDKLLTRCGTTTDLIAEFCRSGLNTPSTLLFDDRSAVDTAGHHYRSFSTQTTAATPGHLMSGASVPPGSASRRQLTQPRHQLASMRDITKKQTTQRAALLGQFKLPTASLNLIASLKDVGRDLPERLALQQLQFLARLYEDRDDLDGQIAVLSEITERFPDAAESRDAAEQLFQFYSSEELRFLRKKVTTEQMQEGPSRIRQTSGTIPGVPSTAFSGTNGGVVPASAIGPAPEVRSGRGTLFANSSGSDTAAVEELWDRKAAAALSLLERLDPDRAGSARIILRKAANARRAGTLGAHQTILTEATAHSGLHSLLARAELQAMHGAATVPVPVINIQQTSNRPFLDGNLDELCWQNATEIHLHTDDSTPNSVADCLLMISWDAEFIYLGARAEFTGDDHKTLDRTAPRRHDADHGLRDRIQILFDVDRDYATGFQFTIDEAGQTSDYCWRSRNWNPQWFVAEDADETAWRFEAAIPHGEMKLLPIRAGELWAVRMHRIVPGTLEQTLSNKYESEQQTNTRGFGLLRFIRNQN